MGEAVTDRGAERGLNAVKSEEEVALKSQIPNLKRPLAVGLTLALVISSVGLPSLAQSTSAKPGDFFLQEWGVATAATSLVFLGGVWATTHVLVSPFVEAFERESGQITLEMREEFSQLRVCFEGGDGFESEACKQAMERFLKGVWNEGLAQTARAASSVAASAVEMAIPGFLTTLAAVPVASTLAVVAVGSSNGVVGNIPLTILGSLGGMLTSMVITGFTVSTFGPRALISSSTLGSLTAFGVTVGYNIGAKMGSESEGAPAGMEFTLPLFATRF